MRSSRRTAVALVLLGAVLALGAQTRDWVSGSLSTGVSARTGLTVTGGTAMPAVGALALVAGAGAVVLLTAGRLVRRVAAGLVLLAGLGVALLALSVGLSPRDDLRPAAEAATGATAAPDALTDVRVTAWPFLATLGGVLVAAGGGVALARSSSWRGPSARYDRPATTPAADDPPQVWDALSRGDDPTA